MSHVAARSPRRSTATRDRVKKKPRRAEDSRDASKAPRRRSRDEAKAPKRRSRDEAKASRDEVKAKRRDETKEPTRRRRRRPEAEEASREPGAFAELIVGIYRAALMFAVPGAWFALGDPFASVLWIPALLALGIAPLVALYRRRIDIAGLTLALIGCAGGALLPGPAALWVGAGATLLAFALVTPLVVYALEWSSDNLV